MPGHPIFVLTVAALVLLAACGPAAPPVERSKNMPSRHTAIITLLICLILVACGKAEPVPAPAATSAPPTATSMPPTAMPAVASTEAATEPAAEATATVIPTEVPPLSGSGGGVIAFTSERDGNLEIYVMNADGSDPRRLTNHPGEDYWPAWSPDGRQIAFASERDGNFELYVMNADGSDQRRLTDNSANDLEPDWSPDGKQIAFMYYSGGKNAIYVMDADGSNRRQLTDSSADDWLPTWSPDGTQIVFVSRRDGNTEIYVMDTAGDNQRRLTSNPGDDTYPAWSPDGTQISFSSTRGGSQELYLMDTDGTNLRQLTRDDAPVWVSAWSPDGTQIAFTSAREGNREIYIMEADGTNLRRLTDNRVLDGIPAWRPASTPPDEVGYTPIFEPGDCRFDVPVGYEVECGDLVVPENRSRPRGPTIRLHIGVFKSTSPDPEPDPVIHLMGGPGASPLDGIPFLLQRGGDEILKKRDYVLFSQRGTHYAVPFLDCPGLTAFRREMAGQDLSLDERYARELDFWLDCQDSLLAQGIDLAAYNSAENAADVNDLRIALGYEQVNLYGISYGSRLALTVLRDHSEGIRCAVIDSIWPPQVSLDHDVALNAHRAFSALFEACTADGHCSQTYPDLETTFYRTIRELNANPVSLQVSHGTVIVDGYDFLESAFLLMYSINDIPWLPAVISQAAEGALDGTLFEVRDRGYYSQAMQYSVRCREELAFESRDEALALAAGLPPELKDFFADTYEYALCASWQAGKADPLENEAVVSDVPTLVLSGRYDPITPPAYGRLAAETLSHSYFYEFATLSHGVMRSNECALAMGLQFLDDPATEPDTSCMEQLTGPSFR